LQFGIKRITQAFAEKGEAKGGKHQRHACGGRRSRYGGDAGDHRCRVAVG